MINKLKTLIRYCSGHRNQTIFLILLACFIYLRFYQLPERANLGWDQIDSAWAAKSIIVDKHILLQGVPVKNDSGIYMGPLYYYLIAPVYFLTNLDPIASPIFAGITSVFGFSVLFYVTKKIFNTNIALIALFINTFSFFIMSTDRVQNAIGLTMPISYMLFYFLYEVVIGEVKYLKHLAFVTGFSFHIDFTSIFYPIIIFFSLPFFPRSKKTLYSFLIAIPIFLVFLLPSIIFELQTKHSSSSSMMNLLGASYHGFHLVRVLQLTHDAFIGFLAVFQFNTILGYFAFILIPLFGIIYYFQDPKKDRLLLLYLISLWIVVPWFVLSTYSGELTNSYFSLSQDICIAILAFLTMYIFEKRNIFLTLIPTIFWSIFAIYNMQQFYDVTNGNFLGVENTVKEAIQNKKVIPFKDKDPYSYVYYVYKWQEKKTK